MSAFIYFILLFASSVAASSRNADAAEAPAVIAESGVSGGLVVHLGCGDGGMTAELLINDAFLVHGLDADAANIEKARRRIRGLGMDGKVVVEQWSQPWLPHAENTVNLLLVENQAPVPDEEMMRVLRPLGVACVRRGADWTRTVKPWPPELDEWTHFLRDSDNNAVSRDSIAGPPHHLQWMAGPAHARSHEHLSSMSVMVSAGGRVFYIADEGPLASVLLPANWFLIARDAFNGKQLWKREVPDWMTSLRSWTSGPVELGRRLVASGDRLYVTLGFEAPVSVLDAADGADIIVLEGTANTHEMALCDGVLAVVMTKPAGDAAAGRRSRPARTIAAFDAASGGILWEKDISEKYADLSLSLRNGRLAFREDQTIVCLDMRSGAEKWRSEPLPGSLKWPMAGNFGVTVVLADDVVLHGDGGHLTALSAADGKKLWANKSYAGHASPADLFVINGLVWNSEIRSWGSRGFDKGLDLATGQIALQWPDDPLPAGFRRSAGLHHRCHRNRATTRFILTGRVGAELVDLGTGEILAHNWVRGSCQFGYIPANGLLYFPLDPCICCTECMLTGITALAPKQITPDARAQPPRIERGPAFDATTEPQAEKSGDDWPTYRHDPARSGATGSKVPAALVPAWRTKLGGRLSSLTCAEGKVFVASVDEHMVHALDAENGGQAWSFTAGGRVDSPPTITHARAIFGCADGYVYCLRAADGALAWRFRAAPEERRVIVLERLESAWPVHGSVLVAGGSVYCAAGRTSYVDGGIRVYKLNPQTGEPQAESAIYSRDPATGAQPDFFSLYIAGALNDILAGDGERLYMRHLPLDFDCTPLDRGSDARTAPKPHLFSPTGFLDDSWWHRTYWLYGRVFLSSWGWWAAAGNCAPAGRILCVGENEVYGYGRNFFPRSTPQWKKGEYYQLFAAAKNLGESDVIRIANSSDQENLRRENIWERRLPFQVKAMAKAADTLFLAGPMGDGTVSMDAYEGGEGTALWAVSAADGADKAQYEMDAPPVFDGLIAAGNGLFVSMKDGTVARFKGVDSEEALLEAASDAGQKPNVRAAMIAGLAERGASAALPFIREAARAPAVQVRTAAARAIAAFANSSDAPLIVAALKNAETEDERHAAADALAALTLKTGAAPSDLDTIVSELGESEPDARRALLQTLNRIGGAKALEAVAQCAGNDPDDDVRKAAVAALADWPDSTAADALLALAGDDANEEIRAAALNGYIGTIGAKAGENGATAADAAAMCRTAVDLAERDEERLAVFRRMADLRSQEALALFEECLDEMRIIGGDKLLPAAESLFIDAASALGGTHAGEAAEALERFCGETKDKKLVDRAIQALQELEQSQN